MLKTKKIHSDLRTLEKKISVVEDIFGKRRNLLFLIDEK